MESLNKFWKENAALLTPLWYSQMYVQFLECKDVADLPCIYCWVKISIHE
jgi:hypothetical protein